MGIVFSGGRRECRFHRLASVSIAATRGIMKLGRPDLFVAVAPGPCAPATSGDITLALLGGFDLRVHAQSVPLPKRAQRLLAFLALHSQPLSRGYVAGSLWIDVSEGHAYGNLRSALWKLGHVGCPLTMVAAGRISLRPEVSVDLHRSVHFAKRLLHDARGVATTELDESLLSQDLLPDWYEDWVLEKREQYRQLRLHALELVCERLITLGSFGHAVQAGLAAVAGEPLRESAQRILITAYLAEQNVCEARRQYRLYRSLLCRELGEEPSPQMRELVYG